MSHGPERLRTSFWCTAVAYGHGAGRPILFGAHPTPDARLAVRWLQMRVTQLAEQLDAKHIVPAARWLADENVMASAMQKLCHGESYSLTISDDQTVYVFTAQMSSGTEPVLPGRESAWPI